MPEQTPEVVGVADLSASLIGLPSSWFEQVEDASEYFVLLDSQDRVVYINQPPHIARLCVGQSVTDFVDVDDHAALRTAVTGARESGRPQRFTSRAIGLHGGMSVYSNWVVDVRGKAAEGLLAVIARPVPAQRPVEAELELTEMTLRSLINNSPDAILIVDSDRRIVFVNQLRHGYALADVLGQPAELFVPDADRQMVVSAIERVITTGEPYSYTSRFASPEGERRFSTRVAPIPGDAGVDRVMLVATDVTAEFAAAQEKAELTAALHQAQKMDSLGQLTGGVAHDFNNILVAISGNLELARLSDDPADRGVRIDAALDAVHHAKTLTERLLAFSRKQTLRPRPIDVGELVIGMRELLTRSLGENVRVHVDAVPNVRSCRVDPAQLESAVLNLAVNARDAMPDGGDLFIRTTHVVVSDDDMISVPPGQYVLLEVTDDGIGMGDDVAARAFEPFFTTKGVGVGTGLGLSMVYGFVLQSGGHVRLLTAPGEGTTVQVYLRSTRMPAAAPERNERPGSAVRGNHQLILVVEDNEMVRSLTVGLLDHFGYRTVEAADADAALDLLATEPAIELIVTDLVLPGSVDGFVLAARARVMRPGLPVLYVSGYPQDVLDRRGALAPNDALLMKPFTADELADSVGRKLGPSDEPTPT